MKIYLIRHGETTGDIEGRFGGDYDDHLTPRGEKQAMDLAEYLKDKNLDIILHSPRFRAVETAQLVSEAIRVSAETINSLRERNNYGVLSGLTKEEAKTEHPTELEKIENDKIYHNVAESESYEDTKVRALSVLKEVSSRPERIVAVVSHGGIIGTVLREVFGHQTSRIGDCGVVEIDYNDDSYTIVSLKDVTLD